MELTEKTLKSNKIYGGKVLTFRVDEVLLPNGKTGERETVHHGGGVGVIALTDGGEILLVKQFRYPYREVVLEIPAGKREKNEEPLSCGKRELKEETGAVASEFFPLGRVYPSPGYTDEVIYLFGAKGLSFGETKFDEDEFLNTERLPLEKAVEMVLRDEITDSKTQIAILKLAALKNEGKL